MYARTNLRTYVRTYVRTYIRTYVGPKAWALVDSKIHSTDCVDVSLIGLTIKQVPCLTSGQPGKPLPDF